MLAAALVGYFLLLLAVGLFAQRRTRDEADFWVGGRRLGALIAAVGASASSSSAWSLLGVSGAAYAWGLSALWLFPACVGGFLLNWGLFARPLGEHGRRTGAMTLLETIAGPGEGPARRAAVVLAGLIALVSLGAYVAAQFQGAGKTFEHVFDVPAWQCVVAGAGLILVYTLLGGFHAVSLTDTIQGLVMLATAATLPLVAFASVGGLDDLAEGLRGVAEPGYASLGGPRAGPVAVGFALGLLGIGLGYPGQPHVAKYFLAVRDGGEVRRARTIAVGWAVVVYAGMILLGLCGRVLFPTLEDREVVLVAAAQGLLHPVVAGVMLAAVLSAMMSTADSQLLVAASTITHDLGLGRRLGRAPLVPARVVVLLLVVAATGAALVGSQEIFSRVLFGWAAMGAAFGPLLFVRVVLGRRVSPGGAVAAMAGGFALSAGAHLFYEDLFATSAFRGAAVHVLPYAVALGILTVDTRSLPPASAGRDVGATRRGSPRRA